MKYFPEKLLSHEVFRSMVSWVTKCFEKFVKHSGRSSYILNVRSLNSHSNTKVLVSHKSVQPSIYYLFSRPKKSFFSKSASV